MVSWRDDLRREIYSSVGDDLTGSLFVKNPRVSRGVFQMAGMMMIMGCVDRNIFRAVNFFRDVPGKFFIKKSKGNFLKKDFGKISIIILKKISGKKCFKKLKKIPKKLERRSPRIRIPSLTSLSVYLPGTAGTPAPTEHRTPGTGRH
jgi:hypothetical protein